MTLIEIVVHLIRVNPGHILNILSFLNKNIIALFGFPRLTVLYRSELPLLCSKFVCSLIK